MAILADVQPLVGGIEAGHVASRVVATSSQYGQVVVEFLSSAWIELLDQVLRASGLRTTTDTPVVIHQIVTGVPGAADQRVSYSVTLTSDGAGAAGGLVTAPTVTFEQSWHTAVAIGSGSVNAGRAVLDGSVTITGAVTDLLAHRDVLLELSRVVASIGPQTAFASPET